MSTDRQTDKPTHRQTNRQTDTRTDRQTNIVTFRAAIQEKKQQHITLMKLIANTQIDHQNNKLTFRLTDFVTYRGEFAAKTTSTTLTQQQLQQ